MELVNLSWLFAYFMNATQAATPNVPRIISAGHLRYSNNGTEPHHKNRQLTPGTAEVELERGMNSPRPRAVLVFVRVWRSIDAAVRVRRTFRQGVVRLELVGMVVEPKALLSRRASPGSM
jgi:hypothetical protein